MKAVQFVTGGLFAALAISFALTQPAAAAPTAESCFAFTPATGTITNYYNTEGNVAGAPACPRDVEIPGTIGGVDVVRLGGPELYILGPFYNKQLTSISIPDTVTFIGNTAFSNNNLTSLSIPPTVTSVASGAFSSNKLTSVPIPSTVTSWGFNVYSRNLITSLIIPDHVEVIPEGMFYMNRITDVTIPDGVKTIEEEAFLGNHITEVDIPDTVTSIADDAFSQQVVDLDAWNGSWSGFINDLYAYETTNVERALDALVYTRLYTQSRSNPNDIQDGLKIAEVDADQGGTYNDPRFIGGHIVNPSEITTRYVGTAGQELLAVSLATGRTQGGVVMSDYYVSHGPQPPTGIVDVYNPTPQEQDVIRALFSIYYRLGQSTQLVPPSIDGYITPSPVTIALANHANSHTFVYPSEKQATPATTSVTWQNGKPLITGTYDPSVTDELRVKVDGTVYVLGASDYFTADGTTWTLDLTQAPQAFTDGQSYQITVLAVMVDGQTLSSSEATTSKTAELASTGVSLELLIAAGVAGLLGGVGVLIFQGGRL